MPPKKRKLAEQPTTPETPKNWKGFQKVESLRRSDSNNFSHTTQVHTKKPKINKTSSAEYVRRWYLKEIKLPETKEKSAKKKIVFDDEQKELLKKEEKTKRYLGVLEVTAQELFRLLNPCQIKTRLVTFQTYKQTKFFVASKEVRNEKNKIYSLPSIKAKSKNLGMLTVCAIFLNEIDFKLGNIFFDDQDNLTKIDGNWCFAHFFEKYRYINNILTSNDLDALPLPPQKFTVHHWLEYVGVTNEEIKADLKNTLLSISASAEFRHEVNETLLKIITLPDALLRKFVESYTNDIDEINTIYQTLQVRREMIKNAAGENASFKHYINSNQAEIDFNNHINYLTHFKTMRKHGLLDQLPNITDELNNNFIKLKNINNPIVFDSIPDGPTEHGLLEEKSIKEFNIDNSFLF